MNKDRMGKHISLLYRYSQIFFNKEFKRYNLGSGQYMFLIELYKHPGITQEQLSERVRIDKATTAKAIAKLIAEGYVTKETSATDKRAYNLYTTEKAAAIQDELFLLMDGWNQQLLDGFSTAEQETAHQLLEKMCANALAQASRE
ncbi:MarR family transcriptional regulator [Azotosporobacter soli]|uniref:MarR family winged helix-turn-helix transcriptional regulator n=1 Tax=Azotosporobacter soli TaxID=3055040 RepID=UPI0031FEFA74